MKKYPKHIFVQPGKYAEFISASTPKKLLGARIVAQAVARYMLVGEGIIHPADQNSGPYYVEDQKS